MDNKPANRSQAFVKSEPGLGDDIPCSKCGAALDTGLECTECGHDMRPEIYPAKATSKAVESEQAWDSGVKHWHELKTDPEVWDAVASGAKTHEIRFNDRAFAVGDGLVLRKTRYTGAEMRAGKPLEYIGTPLTRVVSHVLTGYGLTDGWVILSFALPASGAPAAAPAGKALRWLTTYEKFHAIDNHAINEDKYQSIQRKFCEVNGLKIGGADGGTD